MTDAAHAAVVGHEVRLGKQAKKEDDRNLQMARYLTAALPAPPTALSRVALVEQVILGPDWGMMENDRLGDCTCAALGHAEQTWAAIAMGANHRPSDAAVESLYWKTGDGSKQDDTGRYELDVLNYVQQHSLFRHKVHAFAEIGLHNADLIKSGIALFGGAYIGLSLPESAQHQLVWDVVTGPTSEPGSWGGHAVWLVEYDLYGPTCITWGKPLKMSWSFFWKYCDEAYALVESEWFKRRHTPDGLNLQALMADLEAIK